MKHNWRIGADLQSLKQKNALITTIRDYFNHQNFLEVEVPILGKYPATDGFINSLKFIGENCSGYLQTSPESYLKQFMTQHCEKIDVFTITKAFRDDSSCTFHQPEFSLLEWYRNDYTWRELAQEVIQLIQLIHQQNNAEKLTIKYISYDTCMEMAGISPSANTSYQQIYQALKLPPVSGIDSNNQKVWRQLLWSEIIENKITQWADLVIVYDYPIDLSLWAEIDQRNQTAKRFEIYYKGIELANGWQETHNQQQIKQKIKADQKLNQQNSRPNLALDIELVKAQYQLPQISGVALGLDRLFSMTLNKKNINEILTFYYQKQ